MAPAWAPPDGDDGTPGWGRLCPASLAVLIIGHVADRRGSAQQEQCGGEEKEVPRRGAGEGVGAAVARGGGGVTMQPPLAFSSRCGNSCRGGAGVSSETTDDEQTTIKS